MKNTNFESTSRRSLAMLLVLLTLSNFACGSTDNTEPDSTTDGSTSDDSTTATDSADTTVAIDELEVRDLGDRDVNILLRSEWDYEFMVDEESGDTVSDAIYKRNTAVEDSYNCNLNFIDFAGDWANHDNFTNIIHNSVLAGDGAYDFIAGYQAVLTLNIQNGDLMNLYEVPHLELDAPWWTEAGIEELTFNGRCYQVGGDIAVSLLEGINCMFYNKRLAEDFSVPDLYELVRAGEWTHDKMLEVSRDIYLDVNSDGLKGTEDRFGFISQGTYIRTYVVAYDTPTISDEGDIIWNTEHTINVIEKLVDCFASPDVYETKDNAESEKLFSEGRALLMNCTLGTASKLRSMDDDFGIIPYPKFDENQENYMTTTANDVSMICVPVTAPDPEVSGLIIEALCRESHDTVAPAFYEVALKSKYTRDENSAEMIDLIRESLTFDFGWISSMATIVSGAQYQLMVEAGNKDFASWYAANEAEIQAGIDGYLSVYRE